MTRFLRWSLRAYSRLLKFYPEDLQSDFGAEMLEAFEGDLSAECAANSIKGSIRVWRIALHETIRIALPAWLQIPAVVVPALSAVAAVFSESPLLIVTVRRHVQTSMHSAPTPLDAIVAIAIAAAVTALTSFVAVYRWERASLVTLDLHGIG